LIFALGRHLLFRVLTTGRWIVIVAVIATLLLFRFLVPARRSAGEVVDVAMSPIIVGSCSAAAEIDRRAVAHARMTRPRG
jgi:di/tricarboxylate transporter